MSFMMAVAVYPGIDGGLGLVPGYIMCETCGLIKVLD